MERWHPKSKHDILYPVRYPRTKLKRLVYCPLQLKYRPVNSVPPYNQSTDLDQLDFNDLRLFDYFRFQKFIHLTDRFHIRLCFQEPTFDKNRFHILCAVPHKPRIGGDCSADRNSEGFASSSPTPPKC